MTETRDFFFEELKKAFGEIVHLNGHLQKRLPNTLNVSFTGFIESEILAGIPEVAASTESACHEGENIFSPVLRAMNCDEKIAPGAVRFSIGRFTTREDVQSCVTLLKNSLKKG